MYYGRVESAMVLGLLNLLRTWSDGVADGCDAGQDNWVVVVDFALVRSNDQRAIEN